MDSEIQWNIRQQLTGNALAETGTVDFNALLFEYYLHHSDLFWRKVSKISIMINGTMKTKPGGCCKRRKDEKKIHWNPIFVCD